ncbi:MAG TPA: branched-chain amino acid ABC transporter permease, partial [Solirubrobacteraceae bacterium]|nr:branched-chain amino acid ABC transporter permease [Solirubrobacteraceae bacterium]
AASALRVRGVSLVVVTLAAAVAFEQFVFSNSTWGGGTRGAVVPEPHIGGFDLGPGGGFRGIDGHIPSPVFGFFVLVVVIGLGLLVANLPRVPLGARMLAVRSNERAAAAAGVHVRNTKLAAFTVSSLIAGLAGMLYAYNYGSVSADSFDPLTALTLIALAYVGGITMVSGALIAGVLTTEGISQYAFEKWFGISGTWVVLLGGVTLLLNLVLYPDGIAGGMHRERAQKRAKREAEGRGETLAHRLLRPRALKQGIGE